MNRSTSGTNIGIHDPVQAAQLIHLCDNYGMDSISLGGTISYLLAYNQRHPEKPLLNGAHFGDFDKIKELVIHAGQVSCRRSAMAHGVFQRVPARLPTPTMSRGWKSRPTSRRPTPAMPGP